MNEQLQALLEKVRDQYGSEKEKQDELAWGNNNPYEEVLDDLEAVVAGIFDQSEYFAKKLWPKVYEPFANYSFYKDFLIENGYYDKLTSRAGYEEVKKALTNP